MPSQRVASVLPELSSSSSPRYSHPSILRRLGIVATHLPCSYSVGDRHGIRYTFVVGGSSWVALPSAGASDNRCDPLWAIANVTSPDGGVEERERNNNSQGKETVARERRRDEAENTTGRQGSKIRSRNAGCVSDSESGMWMGEGPKLHRRFRTFSHSAMRYDAVLIRCPPFWLSQAPTDPYSKCSYSSS